MRHFGGCLGARKHRQAGHPNRSGVTVEAAKYLNEERDAAKRKRARLRSRMFQRVRDLMRWERVR